MLQTRLILNVCIGKKVITLQCHSRNMKILKQYKKVLLQSVAFTSMKMPFQSQTYEIIAFIFLLVIQCEIKKHATR